MYLIMDRFGVLDLEDGEEIPDPLPPNLRVLRVTRSPTKVLPLLPSTLNSISVTHSALDSIGNTDWHALVQLETVDLSHNNLKSFEINAPPNLASLKLEFNVIDRFEIHVHIDKPPLVVLDLTGCRMRELPSCLRPHWGSLTVLRMEHNPLWYTEFSDLPWSKISLEVMPELADAVAYGVLTSSRMRRARYMLRSLAQEGEVDITSAQVWFADIDEITRVQQRRAAPMTMTHNNPQNVHLPSNQESAMTSLVSLRMRRTANCPNDQDLIKEFIAWHMTRDSTTYSYKMLNTAFCCMFGRQKRKPSGWVKKFTRDCEDPTKHGTFNMSYGEMVGLVLSAAYRHDAHDSIFTVLKDEIIDGGYMCFTGRMSRLLNALGGFIEGIGVHLSTSEELANAISQIRSKNVAKYGEDTDAYLANTIADVQKLLEGTNKSKDECETWIEAL